MNSSLLPFLCVCPEKDAVLVMEVTYTLTREDLAAARRFHTGRHAKGRVLAALSVGVMLGLWLLEMTLLARAAGIWRDVLSQGPRGWAYAAQAHEHLLLSFSLLTLFLVHAFWGQKLLLARQGQMPLNLLRQSACVSGRKAWTLPLCKCMSCIPGATFPTFILMPALFICT